MISREERRQKAIEKRKVYAEEISRAVQSAFTSAKEKFDENSDEKAFIAGEAKWNSLIKTHKQESSLIIESIKYVTGEAERIFKVKAPQIDKPVIQQKKSSHRDT